MFIIDESVTSLKEVAQIIPSLGNMETASLLIAIGESICQCQTLGESLEDGNIYIPGLTDDACVLLPGFRDVSEQMELIALIAHCAAQLIYAHQRWS